jgi:hypothetical protein
MPWGSSPYVCQQCVRKRDVAVAYINEGLLALDARLESVPADLDVQVLALVLGLDADGDVDVLDGLVPLVRQRGLLGLLLCERLGVGLFALLRGR